MNQQGDKIDNDIRIKYFLENHFRDHPVNIILCPGKINIPTVSLRPEIIREGHEMLPGGHKGIVKTFNRVRKRVYWSGLKQGIKRFIKKCRTSQLEKLQRIKFKKPMLITKIPSEAFERISINTVGPLPKTSRGHCHILTIQDNFAKPYSAIPLKNIKAHTIAYELTTQYIALYSCPKIIVLDKGSSFLRKLFTQLSRILRFHHITTWEYRPQSNALAGTILGGTAYPKRELTIARSIGLLH